MPRSTALKSAFAILAIAFFAAPIALRAVGITATAFENRRFAEAPRPSQGWDAFQQAGRFLTDRLPLREQAVKANNGIWRSLFGTSPRYGIQSADAGALPFAGQREEPEPEGRAPKPGGGAARVLEGREGWLFLREELIRACTPPVPMKPALARWRELLATVRAAGKRTVLVVPPDKGSIYGEHLPDGRQADCARPAKRRFWDLLEHAGGGVIPLEPPLARRKRRGAVLLYSKADTHWTRFGSLELVRAVLDRVGGPVRLKPEEIADLGTRKYVGDLTVLLGDDAEDSRPVHTIRRAPGAARIPGRALFVYDSFGAIPLPLLRLYFEDLRALPWVSAGAPRLTRAIAASDVVIFDSVERELATNGSDAGLVSRRFLQLLRTRLGSR